MDIEQSEFQITDRMKKFVDEYLIDFNATQAAIRAGYSPDTANEQGSQLLARPDIRELVAEGQKEIMERTQTFQDDAVDELKVVGFSNLADFLTVKDGGIVEQKPFNELTKEQTKCIKKIKQTVRSSHSADGTILHQTAVIEIELHDKLKALELLGRHLGMFNDTLRLEGALPLTISFEVAPQVADIIITRGQGREQKKLQA
ncbi:MAG: terminase small subunit [Smithellaceae bacterium]|jgi:phage terminase small subunit|nr:terminase small subunit [Smithellaceae bacterium]